MSSKDHDRKDDPGIDCRARNKAAARRFYAAIESADETELAAVCAPGARFHVFGQEMDFAGHLGLVRGFKAAFAGGRFTDLALIAEGDRVITRLVYEGVHEGPFQGVAATGRRVRLLTIGFHRLSGGRIVEHHGHADAVGLMGQLAVAAEATPPAAAAAMKDLVQRFQDLLHGADPAAARALVTPDCVFEVLGQPARGFDEHVRMVETFNQALTGARFVADDWTIDGDTIGCRFVYEAAHTGAFSGLPPSGKRVSMTGLGLATVRDGRVARWLGEGDMVGFLKQLGAPGLG